MLQQQRQQQQYPPPLSDPNGQANQELLSANPIYFGMPGQGEDQPTPMQYQQMQQQYQQQMQQQQQQIYQQQQGVQQSVHGGGGLEDSNGYGHGMPYQQQQPNTKQPKAKPTTKPKPSTKKEKVLAVKEKGKGAGNDMDKAAAGAAVKHALVQLASASSCSSSSNITTTETAGLPVNRLNRLKSKGKKKTEDDGRWQSRFVWPDSLHRDFASAVFDLGLKNSSPNAILNIMTTNSVNAGSADVSEISAERIKSHLQKFRLHKLKSREEFMASYDYALARYAGNFPQNNMMGGAHKFSGINGSGEMAAQLTYSSMIEMNDVSGVSSGIPNLSAAGEISNNTDNNNNNNNNNLAALTEVVLGSGSLGSESPAAASSGGGVENAVDEVESCSAFVAGLSDVEKLSPLGTSLAHLSYLFGHFKNSILDQRKGVVTSSNMPPGASVGGMLLNQQPFQNNIHPSQFNSTLTDASLQSHPSLEVVQQSMQSFMALSMPMQNVHSMQPNMPFSQPIPQPTTELRPKRKSLDSNGSASSGPDGKKNKQNGSGDSDSSPVDLYTTDYLYNKNKFANDVPEDELFSFLDSSSGGSDVNSRSFSC